MCSTSWAIFQTFRWLVKPQRRLSGRCWLLISKVNVRHMYYCLCLVICLWSGLATELNFRVCPDVALVSLNYCGWRQNCRQHLEGATRWTHSANSNEAALGSQAKGTHGALSEVSADELLMVSGERQMSKHMNKWHMTGFIMELTKHSESPARHCTSQETFLWPLHLKWKSTVVLLHLSLLPPSVTYVTSPVQFSSII